MEAKELFTFGLPVMAVISMTTVTVTGIPEVFTPCQSAVLHSSNRRHGTPRNVPLQWPQRTRAERIMTNESYVFCEYIEDIHFLSRIRLISSSEVKKKSTTAYSMSSEVTNEIPIVFFFLFVFFFFIFRDETTFVLTTLFLFIIYYSLEKEMQIFLTVRESPMRSFAPLTMNYQTA